MGIHPIFALSWVHYLQMDIQLPSTDRTVSALHPIDGAWIQLSYDYPNTFLSLVRLVHTLKKWPSPDPVYVTTTTTKTWSGKLPMLAPDPPEPKGTVQCTPESPIQHPTSKVPMSHPTSIRNWPKGLQHPIADPNKYTFWEGPWIGPLICYVNAGLPTAPIE